MDFDKVIYLILFIPFLWVLIFEQQNLYKKKVFIKYLSIAIFILILGIVYKNYSNTPNKELVYLGSQMTLMFLILYKIIRIPYYWIFKREPEISRWPEKNVDIIPTIIVAFGSMVLPFLIDIFIIQKIVN